MFPLLLQAADNAPESGQVAPESAQPADTTITKEDLKEGAQTVKEALPIIQQLPCPLLAVALLASVLVNVWQYKRLNGGKKDKEGKA